VTHGTLLRGHVCKLMPRAHLASLDKPSSPGRPSRVLSRWSQFGALVFAPWAGRHSLRAVVTAMAAPSAARAPLGVTPPQRSTLAEAKERRPAPLYHRLFAPLDARGQGVAPGHGFRFKHPLFSVDSTTIARCLNRLPWARVRTTTGAITVQTRLDHAGHLPAFVVSTEGKRCAIALARGLKLPTGRSVAMDRGDIASQFLVRLTQDGVYCVTRQKVNAKCKVTARVAVDRLRGVTADQNVVLPGQHGSAYPEGLRRGGSRDLETGTHDGFWTTAFHRAAATMAARYTARGQVEWCLKTIKQNLQIKTFLGTSENAVMTQLWGALITYLMLAFLRFKSGVALSLQQRLRLLHMNLFDRRNLVDLCHPPQRQTPRGDQIYVA
jgi:hypothetical protein